ncbi:23S rRNA methyltransferase J [Moraxella macacae 0408225]|uniref:Ribosomal RNA large subunit methyltransferase E n=2 Tax=Moraxella macacae TaxID=765840 RepID=L2F9E2_9GAMM|nr:23S rRNA methyltransferase J [Moraxella macacae 0408225]
MTKYAKIAVVLIEKQQKASMATRITNKKLSKSSRAWIKEHLDDHYVKLAHRDGYRARAAYKLLEINDKLQLIKKGMTVVDLGSAPGSWSQVAGKIVGESGKLIASDILPMDTLENVTFIQGDFRKQEIFDKIMTEVAGKKVNIVLSDMAPNTSGFAAVDQPRMIYLCELAVDFASQVLDEGGSLIVKVFQGEGSDALRKQMQQTFRKVRSIKPAASRARSKEMYWVATM